MCDGVRTSGMILRGSREMPCGADVGNGFCGKMGEINMKDVSHLVKKLIAKGLYNKKESSATEPQLLACFETTCSVIKDCQAVQEVRG
eukprot:3815837-Rhodomonas_salina.2